MSMTEKEYAQYTAETILKQLGGNGFMMMTGAKNLLILDPGLQLSINGMHPTLQKRVNRVRIHLTPMDVYKIEFCYVRAGKWKTIKEIDGVYCDQLKDVFEQNSGLYVTLSPRR